MAVEKRRIEFILQYEQKSIEKKKAYSDFKHKRQQVNYINSLYPLVFEKKKYTDEELFEMKLSDKPILMLA